MVWRVQILICFQFVCDCLCVYMLINNGAPILWGLGARCTFMSCNEIRSRLTLSDSESSSTRLMLLNSTSWEITLSLWLMTWLMPYLAPTSRLTNTSLSWSWMSVGVRENTTEKKSKHKQHKCSSRSADGPIGSVQVHAYHHCSCVRSSPVWNELSQLSEVGQPSLIGRYYLKQWTNGGGR